MEPEIRKLPKRTVVFISVMVLLGIFTFFAVVNGKETKATKILYMLGYKNVSNVHIYATQEFLNEEINMKGMQYKVSFIDLDKNQECRGFILKDLKRNIDKDLDCTNIKK